MAGKYESYVLPKLKEIEQWARVGDIDETIAKKLGIGYSTLREYKKNYPELAEALRKGKAVIDFTVENKLLERAQGFVKTVKKPIKVKNTIYENGRKVKEEERIEYVEEELYVPPEPSCIFFWLQNRRPGIWRNCKYIEQKNEGEIKIKIPDEAKEWAE